jgi:hypothetical protein
VQTQPWLGIEGQEATLKEKPREAVDGVDITFFIKLYNYGHSPAIDIVSSIPHETFGGRFGREPRSLSKRLCDAADQDSKTVDPEYGPELVVWPGTSHEYRIDVHSQSFAGTYATGCFSYKSRSGDIHDTFFVYRIGMDRGDPNGEDHTLRITGIELVSMQPLQ